MSLAGLDKIINYSHLRDMVIYSAFASSISDSAAKARTYDLDRAMSRGVIIPERARKRRKLSPPDESNLSASGSESASTSPQPLEANGFLTSASRWNLEQTYENKPRKLGNKGKEKTRLPIKTADGRVEQIEEPAEAEGDDDSWLDSKRDDGEQNGQGEAEGVPQEPQKSTQEQVIEAKEVLARLAVSLNEDPEENPGAFKGIAQWARSPSHIVKQLALATQLTVFKDVIPGYHIRPLSDKDIAEKVSKDVKKRRAFEQALVRSYKDYVDMLGACTKEVRRHVTEEDQAIARTASSCTCELLLAVPHFNFRKELINILVKRLSVRKVDDEFLRCVAALETLFQDDEDGHASFDGVAALSRMIKGRDYLVDESILNTFLHLRLLSELSAKASTDRVDKDGEASSRGKKAKQKREFRTKRQRKALKELKAVEKDFREADAVVSHEERDRLQGETLKLVFGTYFRILKARSPTLTGAVLEGLAKFAHLINQDFFGDLLEVFRELAQKALSTLAHSADDADNERAPAADDKQDLPMDPARIALLCTTTAFSLLSAQDASRLSLDLSTFTSILYDLLLPTLSMHNDLEFSHKTPRLADPHQTSTKTQQRPDNDPDASAAPKINVSTTSTLLLRALTAALSPRSTPPTRLAAFTHRLLTASLHTPEKTTRAIVGLLAELVRTQGRKIGPLWRSEERRGDGEFDPLGDMENCRPYCGSAWEGELLRVHFSDGVRAGVGELEALVAGLA